MHGVHRRLISVMTGLARVIQILALALLLPPPAQAAEKVVTGAVGSPSSTLWPVLIGMSKGYFAASGIAIDLVYAPSAAGLVQQLSAGSLDIIASTGLVEPIEAADRGAPVAIGRIIAQSNPYEMIAKPEIGTLKDLKGKTVTVGGLADITRIYLNRMLAGNFMQPGDVDVLVIGPTGGRLQAVATGAAAAGLLLPPFNFEARAMGLKSLGLAIDYSRDLPFTGMEVNTNWAKEHPTVVKGLLQAFNQSVAWFGDPANRQEAIDILAKAGNLKEADVAETYDFVRRIDFFAPTGRVSRSHLEALIKVLKELDDIPDMIAVERLVIPGVSALAD